MSRRCFRQTFAQQLSFLVVPPGVQANNTPDGPGQHPESDVQPIIDKPVDHCQRSGDGFGNTYDAQTAEQRNFDNTGSGEARVAAEHNGINAEGNVSGRAMALFPSTL